jgi:hypothetical protein
MTRDEVIAKSIEISALAAIAVSEGKEDPSVIPYEDGVSVAPFIGIITEGGGKREISISNKALNDSTGEVIHLTADEEKHYLDSLKKRVAELSTAT